MYIALEPMISIVLSMPAGHTLHIYTLLTHRTRPIATRGPRQYCQTDRFPSLEPVSPPLRATSVVPRSKGGQRIRLNLYAIATRLQCV